MSEAKKCLIDLRSSFVGAAVPTGISLKTCRESALIITVFKCSATFRHNDVFPTPVGPTITKSVFITEGIYLIIPLLEFSTKLIIYSISFVTGSFFLISSIPSFRIPLEYRSL